MKSTAICFLMISSIQIMWCAVDPVKIDGVEVDISMYPHTAHICTKCYVCGATILNQAVILAGGHCSYQWQSNDTQPENDVFIMMGGTNIPDMKIIRKALQIKLHKDFDPRTFRNDIALVLLRKSVPFGMEVQRVVIPKRFPKISEAAESYLVGWKSCNKQNETHFSHLRHIYQRLRSKSICFRNIPASEDKFCTGRITTKYNVARPNGGSALVTTCKTYLQIGIYSFRLRNYPAIAYYTNVTYFYSWIYDTAAWLYCTYKNEMIS